MPYEEFKNIVSLLQSPDIEVIELGRLLLKDLPNVSVWTTGHITHVFINQIYSCVLHPWIEYSEQFIKRIYVNIFGI